MIGTQRSGSNLLRLMLDQPDGLLAPPSAHELQDLLPLAPLYDTLGDPGARVRLARDLTELVRCNALAWPPDHLDPARLLEHLEGPTLAHFVIALYDQAAQRASRLGWVSKCLENVHHAELFERIGDTMRYLHLVRDPRDVALSFRRAPIGPKDPRVIAAAWHEDQQAALRLAARHPERVRIHRFEDLVRRPEESVESIYSWLGVPYQGNATGYLGREDAMRAAALSPIWSNLAKAPMSDRAAAHTGETGQAAFLEQVEEILYEDLARFRYEPAYATAPRRLSAGQIAAARDNDARLRARMQAEHADRDQSAHRRREDFLAGLAAASGPPGREES